MLCLPVALGSGVYWGMAKGGKEGTCATHGGNSGAFSEHWGILVEESCAKLCLASAECVAYEYAHLGQRGQYSRQPPPCIEPPPCMDRYRLPSATCHHAKLVPCACCAQVRNETYASIALMTYRKLLLELADGDASHPQRDQTSPSYRAASPL